jgi:hypothetical protein
MPTPHSAITLVALAMCFGCSSASSPSSPFGGDTCEDPACKQATNEAKTQVAKLFDATSSYFKSEHADRGGGVEDLAPHRCPSMNGSPGAGESGITPPLHVDCNSGPEGKCVPTTNPAGGGQYDIALWNDNPVWNGLNFLREAPHRFHYNVIYANQGTGYGTCQFTIQAFGDLDNDGVFSTYERAGAADAQGVNASVGLYIDQAAE